MMEPAVAFFASMLASIAAFLTYAGLKKW